MKMTILSVSRNAAIMQRSGRTLPLNCVKKVTIISSCLNSPGSFPLPPCSPVISMRPLSTVTNFPQSCFHGISQGHMAFRLHTVLAQHSPTTIQSRSFHASSWHALPVRRRRHRTTSLEQKDKGGTVEESNIQDPSQLTEKEPSKDTNTTESSSVTEDDILTTSTPAITTPDFQELATTLLDKLEKALSPMKAKNDPFVIQRFQGDLGEVLQLDLGPSLGVYQVECSDDEQVLEYSSPISGKLLYFYSLRKQQWIGVDDGNALEGILVRDLIRQCQGLPDL